ncbi:hypothetical protein BHE74_00014554 [Ensete ventricosum]|nr:hypothetical protein GW17_00000268 [Ensete ventricosum]RWW77284.1 hypothetical protein BHE74_00014554 [Ensete ventricosum]RZS08031.1 hypothetical protein BHM03_00038957 [Ensete ventricosum]
MRLLVGCGLGIGAVGSSFFDQMLKQRNPFYKYDASIAAANSFGGFGTTGDAVTRTSEIAAFLAHKRPTKRLVGRQRRRTAHLLGATTHQITADGGRSAMLSREEVLSMAENPCRSPSKLMHSLLL